MVEGKHYEYTHEGVEMAKEAMMKMPDRGGIVNVAGHTEEYMIDHTNRVTMLQGRMYV